MARVHGQPGTMCTLHVDLPLDHPPPEQGDWVATHAGSRYIVREVRKVNQYRPGRFDRYRLVVTRLPKHEPIPNDVMCIRLSWYPR